MHKISNSPEETFQIAKELIDSLKKNTVIALVGDLGAGKTTFVQGMGRALGVVEFITSPTFVLRHDYDTNHSLFNKLYHFDVYRLESENDLFQLGFEELLEQERALIVVEWADKFDNIFPKEKIFVSLMQADDDKREIRIDGI